MAGASTRSRRAGILRIWAAGTMIRYARSPVRRGGSLRPSKASRQEDFSPSAPITRSAANVEPSARSTVGVLKSTPVTCEPSLMFTPSRRASSTRTRW